MSTSCLRHSLCHYGGPVFFLVAVCFAIGVLLLDVAAEISAVFMIAGLGALAVFGVMGARGECGPYAR